MGLNGTRWGLMGLNGIQWSSLSLNGAQWGSMELRSGGNVHKEVMSNDKVNVLRQFYIVAQFRIF